MLPKLNTLSLLPAESAKATPRDLTYPRWRSAAEAEEDREPVEWPEAVDAAVDDVADTDLSSGGHADSAGVGEIDGEGEESLVVGGDADTLRSMATAGLRAITPQG